MFNLFQFLSCLNSGNSFFKNSNIYQARAYYFTLNKGVAFKLTGGSTIIEVFNLLLNKRGYQPPLFYLKNHLSNMPNAMK